MDKISKDIQVSLPKEPVTYQLLNIQADPVNRGRLIIPTSRMIPNIDTIYDPGDKQVKVIKYVVGMETVTTSDGKPTIVEKLGDIFFYKNALGQITISPNNPKDVALYQYMEICNFNASNPHRDKNINPIFQKLDKTRDAKEEFNREIQRNEAISKALNMPYEQLRVLAEQLKVDTNRDPYEVRMAMKVKAEQTPGIFIENSKVDVMDTIAAQMKEAEDKKIIAFIEEENKWVWGQNKVTLLQLQPGMEAKEALIRFLVEDIKGQQSLKKILAKF